MQDSAMPALPSRFTRVTPLESTPIERTFRAIDGVLQREVMLKLPADQVFAAWTAPLADRLLREARALAKIRHPNVVPILWVELTESGPLLVFDLPAGETLLERLGRGAMSVDETIALGIQVAEALVQVHGQGVVHRAVGPSTIRILPDGHVLLGSFTFAKAIGSPGDYSSLLHGQRSETALAAYLPDYSAPEQISEEAADARADVYALGCTLYRCLSGHESGLQLQRRDVGSDLIEVLRRCVVSQRTGRYATAHDVVQALRRLQSAAASRQQGHRWRSLLGIAGLASALALGAWLGVSQLPAKPPELPMPQPQRNEARHQERFGTDFQLGYRRVHGLFIAIDTAYAGTSFARLRNPVKEVTEVAKTLAANDSQWAAEGACRMLLNDDATRAKILEQFDAIVREAQPEDAVLVWFAGHATVIDGTFALAAVDAARPTGSGASGKNFVWRGHLETFLAECEAKHVLVVLDCCHAGAVLPTERTRDVGIAWPAEGQSGTAGTSWAQRFCSREILCSAGPEDTARDGATLSPFCEALLAQLRESTPPGPPCVLARHLEPRIEESMHRTTSRFAPLQLPELLRVGEQRGSFVFRLRPTTGK